MEEYDDLIPREKVLFAFKGISLEGEYEGKPALMEVIFQDWGSPVPRATLRSYPDGIGQGSILIEQVIGDFGQFDKIWTEKVNGLLAKLDGQENGFSGETLLLNGKALKEPLKIDFTFSEQGIILDTKVGEHSYVVAYIEIFGVYGEDHDQCFQNARLVFNAEDSGLQAIPVSTWAEAQTILSENSISIEYNSYTEPKHAGPQF